MSIAMLILLTSLFGGTLEPLLMLSDKGDVASYQPSLQQTLTELMAKEGIKYTRIHAGG